MKSLDIRENIRFLKQKAVIKNKTAWHLEQAGRAIESLLIMIAILNSLFLCLLTIIKPKE
jgi:hypothetical protein